MLAVKLLATYLSPWTLIPCLWNIVNNSTYQIICCTIKQINPCKGLLEQQTSSVYYFRMSFGQLQHLLSFFFKFIYFLLKDNCLQNFVVFSQTSTWISHRYIYIPSLLNLPPHPILLGWYRAPVWVSWAIQQIPIGYLFYIWWCKFPCYSFHTSHPLLPSPMSISLFSMSVSPLLPVHIFVRWILFND